MAGGGANNPGREALLREHRHEVELGKAAQFRRQRAGRQSENMPMTAVSRSSATCRSCRAGQRRCLAHQDLFCWDAKDMRRCTPAFLRLLQPGGEDWGNPLYDWENARDGVTLFWETGSARHALYDTVRLDHFRSFSRTMRVPTVRTRGRRVAQRRGIEFFSEMRRRLGCLPFIAEDLGAQDRLFIPPETFRACRHACLAVFIRGNERMTEKETSRRVFYSGTHDNQRPPAGAPIAAPARTPANDLRYPGKALRVARPWSSAAAGHPWPWRRRPMNTPERRRKLALEAKQPMTAALSLKLRGWARKTGR